MVIKTVVTMMIIMITIVGDYGVGDQETASNDDDNCGGVDSDDDNGDCASDDDDNAWPGGDDYNDCSGLMIMVMMINGGCACSDEKYFILPFLVKTDQKKFIVGIVYQEFCMR